MGHTYGIEEEERTGMNRNRSAGIKAILFRNRAITGTVLFVFSLGLSIGIFMELLLSAADRENIGVFLDYYVLLNITGIDLFPVFLQSAFINFGLFFIMIIGGISIIGFPAILLALLYKGASLGFSSALLLDTLGIKGVFTILLTLAPQNIILLPALLIAAIASLSLSFSLLATGPKGIKKSLTSYAGNFITCYLAIGVLLFVGCLIETLISPLLQQLLK